MGALGIPGFVGLHARGRPLRVDTADRVLAFMGHPPLGPLLRAEVEAFLVVSGTKVSILGEEAVGNPSFVGRLRRGASPYLKTFDRVRAWMAANATGEEIRVIRERLADLPDPFDGTWDAAGEPGAAADVDERAGENHLNTREAAAWLGLSPKTLERLPRERRGAGFSSHRIPGALPARRPREVGLRPEVDFHVRGESRPEEEEAVERYPGGRVPAPHPASAV